MDSGTRTIARAPHADDIAFLTSAERYPIGARGRVRVADDGLPEWRM
jgi:hypothetical protein